MKKILLLILALSTNSIFAVYAADVSHTNVVVEAEVSYQQLKLENEALRRENQMLRRELIAKNGHLPDALLPKRIVELKAADKSDDKDTGYWLAEKSKIRHNNRCRNYRKSKGRPCGANEGRPCKMCGG